MAEIEAAYMGNAAAARQAVTTLSSVLQTLDDEAAADATCRRSYGERWTATPSDLVAAELRGDVAKFQRLADVAGASDGQVRVKIDAFRGKIAGLARGKPELDATIPPPPSTAALGGEAGALRVQLKDAVNALQALFDGRPAAAAAIKERFDRAAAVAQFLAAPATEHTTITERLMNAPWPAKTAFESGFAEQARLLDLVLTMHGRFTELRGRDDRARAREAALQDLNDAVDRCEELRSNVKEGAAFYADLNGHATRLLMAARDMAAARALQQRELMMNIRAASDPASGYAAAAAYGGTSGYAATSAYPAPAGLSRSASNTSTGGGWSTGGTAVAVPVPVPGPPTSHNPFDAFEHPSASGPPMSPGGGYGGYGSGPSSRSGSGGAYGSPAGFAPAAPPAPSSATSAGASPQVSQLVGMGFERAQAERALAANGGDIGRAVAALLDGRV